MKNLWSPWRSQYIESFKEEQANNQCIFCEALNHQIEDLKTLVVYKAKFTYTILNLYPYNNGHLMVVPNRHEWKFEKLTKDESVEMMEQLKYAKLVLEEIYKPQGFNMGLNLGRAGGAGIKEHLHFHIVPRWNGDTNFMPVLGEVKVISQELMETKKKILTTYDNLLKRI
ncbi:MAG: HIT domain-containing protein [Ignavibacteria bacterium]|nr:HIT domain-containing protein [Ignavibacteria bacterium]MBT8381423.1 HIT domain-containing protein [Ignavibacteria bacterium]MBT8392927.1 HIT domain-containing protein [Ignavibacteria bacterium]NNJ53742.1 HIT domain-containing protein [Ignavibacteriaceae bacterium]NNL20597.1 HIT domain-containing protein [Ignavibacteriaceae bacterium]